MKSAIWIWITKPADYYISSRLATKMAAPCWLPLVDTLTLCTLSTLCMSVLVLWTPNGGVFKLGQNDCFITCLTRGDPAFLERGFHMYKGVGVRFADFLSFLLKSQNTCLNFRCTNYPYLDRKICFIWRIKNNHNFMYTNLLNWANVTGVKRQIPILTITGVKK